MKKKSETKQKIYRNSKDLFEAIKTSPKNSVLVFDEFDMIPDDTKGKSTFNLELEKLFKKFKERNQVLQGCVKK